MKIGQFAKKNRISIDAIRYYIAEGLLLPQKEGAQYEFDSRCQKDIEKLIGLKEMGYSIKEISYFFTFLRLGKLSPELEEMFYVEFYKNKLHNNLLSITNIKKQNKQLEDAIENIANNKSVSHRTIGIHLDSLKLLGCHKCGQELSVTNATVIDNHILTANLLCECGISYKVEDGILIGEDIIKNESNELDIIDYIESVNEDYLKNIGTSLEWTYKMIQPKKLKDEIILELGSGSGFLLRYIFEDLPATVTYILIDHDLSRHKSLKQLLSMSSSDVNLIFICSDFNKMPLKGKIADIVIDYTGTTNYSFENKDFLLKSVDRYFKLNATLVFLGILFEKFSFDSMIDEKYRHNFTKSNVKKAILELGFNILSEQEAESLNKGNEKYENFFKEDESVYGYRVYAKRE